MTIFKRQQVGRGVMIWAGIFGNDLVGSFKVRESVKINSKRYFDFREEHYFVWLDDQTLAKRRSMMKMQNCRRVLSVYSPTEKADNMFLLIYKVFSITVFHFNLFIRYFVTLIPEGSSSVLWAPPRTALFQT